jgi:hypothetical protein
MIVMIQIVSLYLIRLKRRVIVFLNVFLWRVDILRKLKARSSLISDTCLTSKPLLFSSVSLKKDSSCLIVIRTG